MDAVVFLRQFGAIPRMRLIAVAAFVVVVAAVVALSVASHPARTKLFATPLYPEQITEVQERLAEWNMPFTPLADNVLVDASHRNELLLKLSLAGVPHTHVAGSQEILAKVAAFTPQAVIDEQTRTGLADDIALALRGIAGVRDASVIIAPARAGTFADESSSDASASVRLQLDGSALSTDVSAGVRAFVAAAVPGLRPDRVTILDDRGSNPLLGNVDESATLQTSLQSALDAMLGAGAAIVRVHVDVDRRSISSHDVRRSPLGAIPIASTTQDERYNGEGKQYGKSSQQLDRGSDTRESTANTDGPRTSRISAAVIVDAARAADLAQIRELAAATLGIDPHRGDTVDVQAIPFSRTIAPKKDPWWLLYGAIVPALPAVVTGAFGVALLRFGREPVREIARAFAQRVRITQTSQAIDGAAPAQVRSALRDEPPHTAAAIISALPASTAAAVLDMYPAQERTASCMACSERPRLSSATRGSCLPTRANAVAMHNVFRSFAELLAPAPETATATDAAEDAQQAPETVAREDCPCVQRLRGVRLFRASVSEAVDASVQLLLQDIAADVLARELQIAPADVAAIVQRAIARFDADEPLRVHVAQNDHAVDVPIPLLIDPELRAGDAIIEFASGSVDARLGTRLACVLEALT